MNNYNSDKRKFDIYNEQYNDLLQGFYLVHPNTNFGNGVKMGANVVIEERCRIGNRVIIGHGCVLRPGTVIGDDSIIGHLTVFEGNTTIGSRTLIHAQCHITKGIVVEDDVFIGPMFCSTNTNRIKHGRNFPLELKGFIVKRAARIGGGVSILPGKIVGENALVGAGSLITKDIPAEEIWYGRPAKKMGDVPAEEIL